MPDITLSIIFKSLNVSTATDYFLKEYPNIERKVKAGIDPNTIPQGTPESDDAYYEDAFPNTKVWAEEVLRRFMIRILRNGRARTLREAEPAEPSWSDFVG